jgi:hypothetical protein
MKTLVFWSAEKANNCAVKLMDKGETVIMSRMMRGGIWGYCVKFTYNQ